MVGKNKLHNKLEVTAVDGVESKNVHHQVPKEAILAKSISTYIRSSSAFCILNLSPFFIYHRLPFP